MSVSRNAAGWDDDPMPSTTFWSNVIMRGTGGTDWDPPYLQSGYAPAFYGSPGSGIRWAQMTPNGIPVLRPISSHVVVWNIDDEHSALPAFFRAVEQTGTGCSYGMSRSELKSAAQLRTDRLSDIQGVFGFTLQQLANVLGVSRAQLYKWLDSQRDIEMHEQSKGRLELVGQLADEWRKLSTKPLNNYARDAVPGATDMLSLLERPELDLTTGLAALYYIRDQNSVHRPSVTEKLHERGFRRRPSARSLPSDA